MPTISVFFGISIRMYFGDHDPPHFHAAYGEFEAQVAIDTLEVIEGNLPRRALSLVLEWAVANRDQLRVDWELAVQHRPLNRIAPLE